MAEVTLSEAIKTIGMTAVRQPSVLVAPLGAAGIGGATGFLVADFFGETVKSAANLTGRAGVAAELVVKGASGVGLMGLGWRMVTHPLARIGFFASGIGAIASGFVDVVKYFLPVEEWGKTFGEKIRGWLKIGESAVEGANQMSREEYEKTLAAQKKAGANKGTVIRL